jgi:hypothetical protein
VVAPDRDQRALAPREPGLVCLTTAFGGLEPGVAISLQHRPCPGHRSLPEGSRAGELAAQRLVAGHRPLALAATLTVAVQQPRPHVPGRPQQPVAATVLPAGAAQSDRGGPVHKARSSGGGHVEHMFCTAGCPVKDRARHCGQRRSGQPHTGCPTARVAGQPPPSSAEPVNRANVARNATSGRSVSSYLII